MIGQISKTLIEVFNLKNKRQDGDLINSLKLHKKHFVETATEYYSFLANVG